MFPVVRCCCFHLFCLHNWVRSGCQGALSFSLSLSYPFPLPLLTMLLLKVNGLLHVHDRLFTCCMSPIWWCVEKCPTQCEPKQTCSSSTYANMNIQEHTCTFILWMNKADAYAPCKQLFFVFSVTRSLFRTLEILHQQILTVWQWQKMWHHVHPTRDLTIISLMLMQTNTVVST